MGSWALLSRCLIAFTSQFEMIDIFYTIIQILFNVIFYILTVITEIPTIQEQKNIVFSLAQTSVHTQT